MNPTTIKYALIGDGSSDKTLMHIIKWILDDLYPKIPNEGQFASFAQFKNPPKSLKEKINKASDYYSPFDLLFVHRDAESLEVTKITERKEEVFNAASIAPSSFQTIAVIPIKMMETWLLIDAEAIKKAAGNRNYKENINLPPIKNLEKEQDPKTLLHDLLKKTSGLKGRSLEKFNSHYAVHLVAENIEDYSILRNLTAFQTFEQDLKTALFSALSIA